MYITKTIGMTVALSRFSHGPLTSNGPHRLYHFSSYCVEAGPRDQAHDLKDFIIQRFILRLDSQIELVHAKQS